MLNNYQNLCGVFWKCLSSFSNFIFASVTKHRCLCFMYTPTARCARRFQFPLMIFTIWHVTLLRKMVFPSGITLMICFILYNLEWLVVAVNLDLQYHYNVICTVTFFSWSQKVLVSFLLYPVLVEFITLGPCKADTPGECGLPGLLRRASQPKLGGSFPLPICRGWAFPPKAPSCTEENFFTKTCCFGKIGVRSRRGSTVTIEQSSGFGVAWLAGEVSQVSQAHCRACTESFGSPQRDSLGWITMTGSASKLLKLNIK